MDDTRALHSTITCEIRLTALSKVSVVTQLIEWSCRLVVLGDCHMCNCINVMQGEATNNIYKAQAHILWMSQ